MLHYCQVGMKVQDPHVVPLTLQAGGSGWPHHYAVEI